MKVPFVYQKPESWPCRVLASEVRFGKPVEVAPHFKWASFVVGRHPGPGMHNWYAVHNVETGHRISLENDKKLAVENARRFLSRLSEAEWWWLSCSTLVHGSYLYRGDL